jgi:hypothetical protein
LQEEFYMEAAIAPQPLTVYGVVFERNRLRLVHDESLYIDQRQAQIACDAWNSDFPNPEPRLAIVVPLSLT